MEQGGVVCKIPDFSCSRCVKRVFYSASFLKCTDMCKHRFGVQLWKNSPLCSSTVWVICTLYSIYVLSQVVIFLFLNDRKKLQLFKNSLKTMYIYTAFISNVVVWGPALFYYSFRTLSFSFSGYSFKIGFYLLQS